MTSLLIDASIALKWFHDRGESDVAEARMVLDAHRDGTVTAHVLDLTFYELGNVIIRALGGSAGQATAILDALDAICPAIALAPAERATAAALADAHQLTFYDASYAAVASARGAVLVTADRELLAAGLGQTAGDVAARFAL